MAARLVFVSLLAGGALAQTTVTTVLLPDFDPQPLVASVVTAAPTGTWFFVQCGSDDSSDCGVGEGMSLLEGPSTYQMLIAEPGVTLSQGCKISGDAATCTDSVGGADADSPTSGVSTYSGLASMSLPITVTAGLDKLSGAGADAATTVSDIASSTAVPTATGASSSAAGSVASQTSTAAGTKATGASATGASAGASKTSAAGGSRATWKAGVMGVAAAIGGMLMM